MEQAHLQIDADRCGRSSAGLVFAGLSLRLSGIVFPDKGWTDFIIVVLSWWADALVQLLRGDAETVELRFMEGPFLVELQQAAPGTWRLQLVEAGVKRRVRHTATVPIAPLVQSVMVVSNRALDLCREHGWWSSDADVLAATLATLREEAQPRLDQ
jgi:hypothetical protein